MSCYVIRPPWPVVAFATLLQRASDALRAALRAFIEARRYAAAQREFNALDQRTLHDIGLTRSEFSSHWLESRGAIEATRRNVGQPVIRMPLP